MIFVIVAAILLSIAIGYKTNINIGFFAIVFAYLIARGDHRHCGGSGKQRRTIYVLENRTVLFATNTHDTFALPRKKARGNMKSK